MFMKGLGFSQIFQVSSVVRHPVSWSQVPGADPGAELVPHGGPAVGLDLPPGPRHRLTDRLDGLTVGTQHFCDPT